jgi:1-pyrroline-5-carboxylate dehydrogenase
MKVTYATLSADNDDLHAAFDAAFAAVGKELGRTYPLFIDGKMRTTEKTSESRNPADSTSVVARVAAAAAKDVDDAIAAAARAYPAWRATPWQERAQLIEKAAEGVRKNKFELAALLVLENGKNRVEAIGEIEETADLYTYYAQQLRENRGFVREMGKLSPADTNTSVLRPYGVWAVVAPWNFPYALLGAPMAAALLAGNTVVGKPSSDTPLSGVKLAEIFYQAGFPAGTVNLLTGSGRVVGDALTLDPRVAGVTFTGSYEVGFEKLYKRFSDKFPKPCIVEMGGKNPAIIMDSADLDRAVTGVYRSAFGMGGQKCSACSRVYVHEKVAEEFLAKLAQKARETVIGNPTERSTYLGPVGTQSAYEDFQRYAALAKKDGRVLAGAEVIKDGAFARGYFVRPTLVTALPKDHELIREELFLPFLCAQPFSSLDEALELANRTHFGLTAGFFSRKQAEIDTFLERIEAGVVYVNRAAGATTGAWPGVQPFGGWKGSGSSGKNIGGLYTLQTYLREQSRTITE